MAVHQINPLTDRRWLELVARHPHASAFHTRGWLLALHRTYGYEPVAFTTSAPGSDLTNAVVFCRVDSWLTGSRLVSLPFADHCQPLTENAGDCYAILESICADTARQGLRYVEVRPLSDDRPVQQLQGFGKGDQYQLHALNLSGSIESLFRTFDKDCVQRRVWHSARVGLAYEEGRSPDLLRKFYRLLILTRRRHQVPPQPFRWFTTLADTMGQMLTVRVMSKDQVPVASILTLEHNGRVIYKYGCSDYAYKSLGATPSLFWHAIQDAKAAGAHTFDMGRSDLGNSGLIAFKSKWGATSQALIYWRYPDPSKEGSSLMSHARKVGGRLLSRLPTSVLIPASSFLYRHAG